MVDFLYQILGSEKVIESFAEHFGVSLDLADNNVISQLQRLFDNCVKQELLTSIVFGSIGLVLMIVSFFLLPRFFKHLKITFESENYTSSDEKALAYAIFAFPFLIVGVVMFFVQLIDIIEIFNFPEKVFIDYIQSYLVSYH